MRRVFWPALALIWIPAGFANAPTSPEAMPRLPSFDESKIGTPPLPLLEQTRNQLTAPLPVLPQPQVTVAMLRERGPRMVSRMPVKVPVNGCPRMPVYLPDSDHDHKMIVKEPAVESVK